jgi:hypothetical protein
VVVEITNRGTSMMKVMEVPCDSGVLSVNDQPISRMDISEPTGSEISEVLNSEMEISNDPPDTRKRTLSPDPSSSTCKPNKIPTFPQNSSIPESPPAYYKPNAIGPFTVIVQNEDKSKPIHPLVFGKRLHMEKINGVESGSIKAEGKYKISICFKTADLANKFTNCDFVVKNHFHAYIPSYRVSIQGVIRGVPLDVSMEEICEFSEVPEDFGKIIKARRLNRKISSSEGTTWNPSLTVVITIQGQILPERIYLFHNAFRVEKYVVPTVMCYNCSRYGHTKTQCRSPARCYRCSEPHFGAECNSLILLCVNCNGRHAASDLSCPELKRQREIKMTMADKNVSYREALLAHPQNVVLYADKARSSTISPSLTTPTSESFRITKTISRSSPKFPMPRTNIYGNKEYKDCLAYENGQASNPVDGCALKINNEASHDKCEENINLQMPPLRRTIIDKISLLLLHLIADTNEDPRFIAAQLSELTDLFSKTRDITPSRHDEEEK